MHAAALLVLAGCGHTHALLLRRWIMRPASRPADVAVLLVNRTSTALYSGMVPGLLAGLYPLEACAIDLRDLCRRAGVGFVQAEITGVALERRELLLEGRPPLRFHTLSLNVGCITRWPAEANGAVQIVKPLEPFLAWLEQRLAQLQQPDADPRLRIRGGGAAAVEVALALRARGFQPELLLRGEHLQLGSAAAERAAEQLLARAGIALQRGVADQVPADLACTGSQAPGWLAASDLPVEAATGRVLTNATLAVPGVERVFASGDCAVIAADPRPAAGVWAVRAAPILAENLRRQLADPPRPLRRWRPQRWALQLLGDGGGAGSASPQALALYGPWQRGPARWLWRWKDRIDRRFMQGFAPAAAMDAAATPMACRGCAAKLPAAPLEAALGRLSPTGDHPAAEDAACVETSTSGALLLQSVDGFPALLDDPWLNARLTTLHACSDLWACGARVHSLQAVVTLPEAAPALQEEWLLQSLAGVRSVLEPQGATLLGGHTLEGRDGAGLGLSLVVNGLVAPERHWPKGPLAAGQRLLLTRPIGSGVLFAAAMVGAARPAWIDAALQVMQQSQAPLVELLAAHGCQACTDVTGFGLLGHLGEMLGPAQQVLLDPEAITALPGALELLGQGFSSTLAPANARALAWLEPPGPLQLSGASTAAQQQLWIDPQTCGPLLAALPEASAPAALAAVQAAGFHQAALIGQVMG
ncbi:selenide, water dikinase SelD [Synechococcus sp. HK05]|uniref:selenide, water dikinase SelD n=1 Tax=Synechococcus sp. HK05 TaxID=2725975 RepID=UPI0020CB41E8|nr:selenide, water dikinase SelD [Synechococcus sp. HK05]